jgi:antitoxin component YwqK of YwqJK toxin-antitoxin module
MIRILATALLAVSLTASGAFATSMGYLVKTDGLYYEMFTDVPFTGEVYEGVYRGAIKNGNREGPWVMYYPSGQLATKGVHKNGEREGPWVWYREDGTTDEDLSGTYRTGEKVSD